MAEIQEQGNAILFSAKARDQRLSHDGIVAVHLRLRDLHSNATLVVV